MKTSQTTAIFVPEDYGISHHASIINLKAFEGPVLIEESTFSDNTINFLDCSVASDYFNGKLTIPTSSLTGLNVFPQFKSLINLRNHNN